MPVQTSYPGVYVQEVPSGVRTIAGVSTSVTAFVGNAKRGPINKATHIFSYADFDRKFGGLDKDSELSYAVRQFFLNGGSRAIVIRLAQGATAASTTLPRGAGPNTLSVTATELGAMGRNISVQVTHNGGGSFDLSVRYISVENPADNKSEIFENLSMDAASLDFAETKVNGVSTLVRITKTGPSNDAPDETPAHGTLISNTVNPIPPIDATHNRLMISIDGDGASEVTLDHTLPHANLAQVAAMIQTAIRAQKPSVKAYKDFTCTAAANILTLSSGSRGVGSSVTITAAASDDVATSLKLLVTAVVANTATVNNPTNTALSGGNENATFPDSAAYALYIGSQANREGIYALEAMDIFNILCLPGITNSGILSDAEAYCRTRRAFLVADAPKTTKQPAQMELLIAGTTLPKSDHAAVYYPWTYVSDPLNAGQPRLTAPCGTIAGLYARIDASRGVWKAAAGTEANLVGVQGTDYTLTDNENGLLNPLGVNCLRIFPASGAVSWGARTLQGNDQLASEYKYVPVRRTALFIEESLFRGLKWVVFEPNDEPLWAQIRLNVGAFMHNLFRQGAFQGVKKDDAYFVKCDRETTTQNDINLGIVNVWVGFAPLKPAEFVVLYLQQMTGQIQV